VKCPSCGYKLNKDGAGVVNYYLIKPNEVVFEKREVICPFCGFVLAKKEFNEKIVVNK